MRLAILFAVLCAGGAMAQDPAYEPLTKAYKALQLRQYDEAVGLFLEGIRLAPGRASVRKDAAYTYLKMGENELARQQFAEAMRLEPKDFHVALEYAFLSWESREHAVTEKAKARRIFDRVRKAGDAATRATAEQAFSNIDGALAAGIERWTKALELAPANFSGHFELAQLAEQRDELELASAHYRAAWKLLPERKSVLLDLGRTLKALNRLEEANATLLACSRGGEPRAAEQARDLLPARYPYGYEFRKALELDPQNAELRRELAYLLLSMKQPADAEAEFRAVIATKSDDLLSNAQLGFLYLNRREQALAMPLLTRVMDGPDEELANRVRAVLKMPQRVRARPAEAPVAPGAEAKRMAEKSFQAGYLKDALKYLRVAHENDPVDFQVMLKMGWVYNMLRDDRTAIRWFALARRSEDAEIKGEAAKAYENLRSGLARFRTTAWVFPLYSSRWKDLFTYGQVKTEMKLGSLPFRPYLSTRVIGDVRQNTGGPLPQYLSESSIILAAGVATRYWNGAMAWAEAGEAFSYVGRRPGGGLAVPDYRGGVSFARSFGHGIASSEPGWFYETNADAVYVSRFGKDFLLYSQHRAGWTMAPAGSLQWQLMWNGNVTIDARRQYWANFFEAGPGIKFRWESMPPPVAFTVSLMRGAHLINEGNPRGPNFFDLRAGVWYAFTH